MGYKLILIFILFLNISCVKSKSEKYNTQNDTKENKTEGLKLSYLADSIVYVPLETKSNTLIKYLNKCIVDENNIFILDDKKVSRYSKRGKFICNIGSIGQGPGEYICCGSFDIDDQNKKVYIWAIFAHKILIYDYEGNLVDRINLKENNISDVNYVNGRLYINHAVPDNGTEKEDGFDVINLKDKQLKSYRGRVVGIDKFSNEVYVRVAGELKDNASVDSLFIIHGIQRVDSILFDIEKKKETDFFYPKLCLNKQKLILGNLQQEVSSYSQKFDRQLKNGRVVHYMTNKPVESKPIIYDINLKKYISLSSSKEKFDRGIENDFYGVPFFWMQCDMLGFYTFVMGYGNTLVSVLDAQFAIDKNEDYFKNMKEDDNPIIVILYIKR